MTPNIRMAMAANIRRLRREINAVTPVDGVSVIDWADKSTWRIDFREGASEAEIGAANAVLQSFTVEGL
jgi:hypothetical protein